MVNQINKYLIVIAMMAISAFCCAVWIVDNNVKYEIVDWLFFLPGVIINRVWIKGDRPLVLRFASIFAWVPLVIIFWLILKR